MKVSEAIYCMKAESERYSEVCEECPLYGKTGCDHCQNDAIDMAIKSLEKQIPKQICGNEYNPICTGDTVSGLCPICRTEFVCITPKYYKEKGFGYCKECGQKLDWEGGATDERTGSD